MECIYICALNTETYKLKQNTVLTGAMLVAPIILSAVPHHNLATAVQSRCLRFQGVAAVAAAPYLYIWYLRILASLVLVLCLCAVVFCSPCRPRSRALLIERDTVRVSVNLLKGSSTHQVRATYNANHKHRWMDPNYKQGLYMVRPLKVTVVTVCVG